MATAPFVVQPQLTEVTLAYRNAKLIADAVLPRVPVSSQIFKYTTYTKQDAFTLPPGTTRVGRKSATNSIDWSASETTAQTGDYGLEEPIPQADILQAQSVQAVTGVKSVDPMARSTELLSDLIALDREQRVASLVFNTASYPGANQSTLSGTSQWSDYVNSNPLLAIFQALDLCIMRPNVLVIGRQAFTSLAMHPKITAAAFPLGGNAANGSAGLTAITRQRLAELLELDEVLVGEGWVNTAHKGQAPSYSRVWGKNAAFIYRSALPAGPSGGMTFGFTAEWGYRVAGTIENDPDIGLRGGVRVRVGESVKEVVIAPDAAYYFQSCTA